MESLAARLATQLSQYTAGVLALFLAMTGNALALGLGNLSGQAILGQPLLIEIPLLGIDNQAPSADCFKIRHPLMELDSAYVLRNAQLQLLAEGGRHRLVVTTSAPVREPVIEFGVAIGCGFEISRDYLLLSSEPTRTLVTAPPPPAVSISPIVPKGTQDSTPKVLAANQPLAPAKPKTHIEKEVTLQLLAQQHYPLQPKAREKYIRMMLQANPLVSRDDQPIVAGTELRLPEGLPIRRYGAYERKARAEAVPHAPAGLVQPTTRVKGNRKPAVSKSPGQDLLVLAAPAQRSAKELLEEAERLTSILMDQTTQQGVTAEKIAQLESTLGTLKQQVGTLEKRINAVEVERQAEKMAAKPASIDMIELLVAVLVGGALGGLSLQAYKRYQLRRSRGSSTSGGQAMQEADAHAQQLPWVKPNGSTDRVKAAKMDAEVVSAKDAGVPMDTSSTASQHDFDFVSSKSS